MAERIAKVIARAGVCSRRKAEELILEEKVSVNGKLIKSPALNVEPKDVIVVNGKKLGEAEETRLWLYHKPAGLITTHKDERDRPTVFENLPADMPRVISVGRLDINSEGLLLLTNNGDLARVLELPDNAWQRRYKVKVHGLINMKKIEEIEKGVTVDGVRYAPSNIDLETTSNTNSWLTISISEGKNREVRNLMKYAGLEVARLIRLSYGPFQLGKIERGEVREVNKKTMKEQLGNKFEL